jgi:hypothetical protein
MGARGELVPLVLIPRFTSFFGTSELATVALDVSAFAGGEATLWRGKLIGAGATFELYTETSHDGIAWFGYPLGGGGAPVPWDPGDDDFVDVGLAFAHRWFRVRVVLTGTDPGVTCWMTGMLEYRTDA